MSVDVVTALLLIAVPVAFSGDASRETVIAHRRSEARERSVVPMTSAWFRVPREDPLVSGDGRIMRALDRLRILTEYDPAGSWRDSALS